ncbi:MAG: TlpA family protein disulfide reductase [Steroidobacteraceae bacterium]|jgi:thiol-disulfide isomerase/thioredoxin|nr:TlpA family protein disulfide reductase [Steroidobacteraceae bacterium]
MRALASIVGALLLAGGCARGPEVLPAGSWRATLALPGGTLPFGLEVAAREGRGNAHPPVYILNGSDRIRVDEVSVEGGAVTLLLPGFKNRIDATLAGDQLRGTLTMVKAGAKEQKIPFAAQRGPAWRFTPPAAPSAPPAGDLAGRWAVTFVDQDGKSYPAVGEFRQREAEVTGTFLTPTGDHRFLAGELHGRTLRLSKFDGGHPFLYEATLGEDGTLRGRFWSGLAWTETFIARRDAAASLGEAEQATRMKAGATRLDFRFPDLGGVYVSLSDPFYRGKVVVVALAGSWCPNCHDEAAFLAPLYREYRGKGLEVVSLMFEQFGDFERAAEATHRFRERYGIDYATLIAGISDKDDAATRLPQLNGVFAFPTTIFVDRSGTVRKLHTGFSGPATGEHHARLTAEFRRTIDTLLAEPAPPPAAQPAPSPAPAAAAVPASPPVS